MSLAIPDDDEIRAKIAQLWALGVVVVAPTGNRSSDQPLPTDLPSTFEAHQSGEDAGALRPPGRLRRRARRERHAGGSSNLGPDPVGPGELEHRRRRAHGRGGLVLASRRVLPARRARHVVRRRGGLRRAGAAAVGVRRVGRGLGPPAADHRQRPARHPQHPGRRRRGAGHGRADPADGHRRDRHRPRRRAPSGTTRSCCRCPRSPTTCSPRPARTPSGGGWSVAARCCWPCCCGRCWPGDGVRSRADGRARPRPADMAVPDRRPLGVHRRRLLRQPRARRLGLGRRRTVATTAGHEAATTNQRMEIRAALEAVRALDGPLRRRQRLDLRRQLLPRPLVATAGWPAAGPPPRRSRSPTATCGSRWSRW